MKANRIKAKPLDYDPYEEDVCGSYVGDIVEIEGMSGLKIVAKEKPSGIGPEYDLLIETKDRQTKRLVIYESDDDGTLVVE